jgi:hypothetical protein
VKQGGIDMLEALNTETLTAMETRFAVLSAGRYALPVRFRVRGGAVECRVPTWSGVGDLLEEAGELMLVAATETGPHLAWVFVRGSARVVPHPDWEGLQLPATGPISPDDLYQLVQIEPKRIERIDEEHGWGFRETADL